jgi:hypothetical protein
VDEIELARSETFHQRRPAADRRWWLDPKPRFLEISFGMSDKERTGIRDGEIADANHIVIGACCRRSQCACGQ